MSSPPVGGGDVVGLGPEQPLTADQGINSCNDVNSIDCLGLLLQPDDLCNCGFVDPVATLTTAKSSPGDALVQLAECHVSLARLSLAHQLADRPTRLTRDHVTDLGKKKVSVGDLLEFSVLPRGKYLLLPVGPVGEDVTSHWMCPCGSFLTLDGKL